MLAPVTFPCSAVSIVCAGVSVTSSDLTVQWRPEIAPLGPRGAAGDGRFLPPAPGKAYPNIRLIFWNRNVAPRYPGARSWTVSVPEGASGMLNVPSEAVVADSVVPSMVIVTPAARRRS